VGRPDMGCKVALLATCVGLASIIGWQLTALSPLIAPPRSDSRPRQRTNPDEPSAVSYRRRTPRSAAGSRGRAIEARKTAYRVVGLL
jgi:hypothetical protein